MTRSQQWFSETSSFVWVAWVYVSVCGDELCVQSYVIGGRQGAHICEEDSRVTQSLTIYHFCSRILLLKKKNTEDFFLTSFKLNLCGIRQESSQWLITTSLSSRSSRSRASSAPLRVDSVTLSAPQPAPSAKASKASPTPPATPSPPSAQASETPLQA